MKHIQLCSCGSGRTQEHCCGKSSSSRNHSRLIVSGALCLLAVGGAIVLAIPNTTFHSVAVAGSGPTTPAAPGARYASDGSVIPTPGGSGRASTVRRPEPWQYDALSNQHWNADCWHWHDGAPPPPDQRVSPTITNPMVTTTSADGSTPITTGLTPTDQPARFTADGAVIPTDGGSNRPSNIKNPTDGQYDAETNQTWSATCWHWHEGKPAEQNPPTVITPVPAPPAASP